MDFENESKQILDNMELIKLREEYDAEVKKFHIQKHLIDVVKKINVDQLKDIGPESKKNIEKAINALHSIDFVKMENSGSTVLGLSTKPIDLLYTEKKALRTQLLDDLPKTLSPVLNFAKSIDQSVFHPEKLMTELIELEMRRRQLTMDVATAKIRECQLLQKCADLKYGPNQKNIAELLRANVSIVQVKGEILGKLVSNNMLTRTTHSFKALQEMENILNDQIAKTKTN